jgi:rare lipoprotein A (peptidoglycan hydrolase)
VPLLLLHDNGTAHAARSEAAARNAHKSVVYPASHLDGVNLPSHLVAYDAPATTTTTAPAASTTTTPPVTPTSAPLPPTTTPTVPPPPPTTTTTAAPRAAATYNLEGDATWYAAAPAGMCASHTLPRGTVLTVVNVATGASTVCTVDDHEDAGYPRVVDLSPEGFSQIADLSQGVVEVTISW